MSELDIVLFPQPVVEAVTFLYDELSPVDVSAVLPESFTSHVLVFATTAEIDLVTRRTRYIFECRDSTDAKASALADEVAALVSAWCRSGLPNSPTNFSLLSLVDSYPDVNKQSRAIVTCEVYFHAK